MAAGLVAFEITFAAGFARWGYRGELFGFSYGMADGVSPALALATLLDFRENLRGESWPERITESFATTYRVGCVFAVEVVMLAIANGRPWGVLIGVGIAGLLAACANDRITGWVRMRMKPQRAVCSWACVSAVPFVVAGQLVTMPAPHPSWSHFAFFLANVTFDSVWMILAVIGAAAGVLRAGGEVCLQRFTLAAGAPLLFSALIVSLAPAIKASPRLAGPVALLLACSAVYAVLAITAALWSKGPSANSTA